MSIQNADLLVRVLERKGAALTMELLVGQMYRRHRIAYLNSGSDQDQDVCNRFNLIFSRCIYSIIGNM